MFTLSSLADVNTCHSYAETLFAGFASLGSTRSIAAWILWLE